MEREMEKTRRNAEETTNAAEDGKMVDLGGGKSVMRIRSMAGLKAMMGKRMTV